MMTAYFWGGLFLFYFESLRKRRCCFFLLQSRGGSIECMNAEEDLSALRGEAEGSAPLPTPVIFLRFYEDP